MPGGTNGDEAIKHVGKRRVRISGSFFPNGSGAVSATTRKGKFGWSVARTSQGLWTITVNRRWMKLVPISCTLRLAAKDTWFAQFGTFTANDAAGTWSVQVRVIDEANALIDVAADADNEIGFELEAVQDTVAG